VTVFAKHLRAARPSAVPGIIALELLQPLSSISASATRSLAHDEEFVLRRSQSADQQARNLSTPVLFIDLQCVDQHTQRNSAPYITRLLTSLSTAGLVLFVI